MYSDKHFEQKLEHEPNGHLPNELSYYLKRKKKANYTCKFVIKHIIG